MTLGDIPDQMLEAKRWLVWRYEGRAINKSCKTPYYVSGEKRGGPLDLDTDQARLATFEEALKVVKDYTGLGFALGPDGSGSVWQGIDLDRIQENQLEKLASELPGYVEYSPSGLGVHGIGYGLPFKNLGSNGSGVEAYAAKRYFTVTGRRVRGEVSCVADFVNRVIALRHGRKVYTEAQEHRDVGAHEAQLNRDAGNSGNSRNSGNGVGVWDDFPLDCRPTGSGQRHRVLFNLARHLKSKYPDSNAKDHLQTVRAWHQEYLPVIGTKEWPETWSDFRVSFSRVRFLEGEGVIETVIKELTVSGPLPEALVAFGYDERLYWIAEFCRKLSIVGRGNFYLSCRTLAELIGVTPTSANKILNMLVDDGILKIIERGRLATAQGPQATVYSFLGWD